MASRRFFIPRSCIDSAGRACLPATEARHLKNVLRIRAGEQVEIFDGTGQGWSGAVEFHADKVIVGGFTELPPAPADASRLVLALALIKPARLEWALEKATELGIDEFVPLYAARSELHFDKNKIENRLERWRRIAAEAAKQCRRLTLPRIYPPLALRELLAADTWRRSHKVLCYEKSADNWCPDATVVSDTVICVGPEGGWTDEELALAQNAGVQLTGLGPHILRAETAALAALAIRQNYAARATMSAAIEISGSRV